VFKYGHDGDKLATLKKEHIKIDEEKLARFRFNPEEIWDIMTPEAKALCLRLGQEHCGCSNCGWFGEPSHRHWWRHKKQHDSEPYQVSAFDSFMIRADLMHKK
jgi:hypothetical protein